MSRFDYLDYDETIPEALWNQQLSNVLAGQRGQTALAQLEQALVDLPEKKLVHGLLAVDGSVCAVGAYVASERAKRTGVAFHEVVKSLAANAKCGCGHTLSDHADGKACAATRRDFYGKTDVACSCGEFDPECEDIYETTEAGRSAGLAWHLAWHLAWLNDEHFEDATPEERYEKMLTWVRRALGKEPVNA